jgi:hypothetical protein
MRRTSGSDKTMLSSAPRRREKITVDTASDRDRAN